MRLGLVLTTVAVKTKKKGVIEKETEIDAEGEIDAVEGVTNKAIRAILIDLYTFSFSFFRKPGRC
jgi:hypothetical protein